MGLWKQHLRFSGEPKSMYFPVCLWLFVLLLSSNNPFIPLVFSPDSPGCIGDSTVQPAAWTCPGKVPRFQLPLDFTPHDSYQRRNTHTETYKRICWDTKKGINQPALGVIKPSALFPHISSWDKKQCSSQLCDSCSQWHVPILSLLSSLHLFHIFQHQSRTDRCLNASCTGRGGMRSLFMSGYYNSVAIESQSIWAFVIEWRPLKDFYWRWHSFKLILIITF